MDALEVVVVVFCLAFDAIEVLLLLLCLALDPLEVVDRDFGLALEGVELLQVHFAATFLLVITIAEEGERVAPIALPGEIVTAAPPLTRTDILPFHHFVHQ
jgi:hypothetical protein